MKLASKLLSPLILSFILLTTLTGLAKADDSSPVPINLDVEGPSSSLFNGPVTVPACATPDNASSTVNGLCAFAAAGLNATSTTPGVLVNSINGISGNWQWFLNGSYQSQNIDAYLPNSGDNVLWALGNEPLKITISTTTPQVNATTTVTVFGFNATNLDFEPVAGAAIVGTNLITDASGTAGIVATSTTPLVFSVTAAGFIPSQQFTITPQQPPNIVILSANSATVGEPFTATAQQYNDASGTYVSLPGVTIGVGTLNPDSSFTEIATSTADSNGDAVFTLDTAGTFEVGIEEDSYATTTAITVTNAPGGGGGGGSVTHLNFNIPNALTFISSSQSVDGSFGSLANTDWAAIAFAAENPGAAKTKLQSYFLNTTLSPVSITDYAQTAMALEALGINPYSGTSINYINAITSAFDGTQIGAPGDTDDIFALIALEHAGFTSSDNIVQKEAAYLLSTQRPDGSWDESPDTTAAAIQALGSLFDINGVNAGLGQSAGFLASTEQADGSWGSIDSTSWVQTAINAIIEANTPGFSDETPWTSSGGFFPTDAIAKAQTGNGSIQSSNSLLSTSYAVVAASGHSWVTLLQAFPKPGASATGGDGTTVPDTATSTATGTPTSTLPSLITPTSTSTPEAATTTVPNISPTIVVPTTTPTTTLATIIPPVKPKTVKPKIKRRLRAPVPAILGESTMAPSGPARPNTIPTPAAQPSAQKNFLGNIWDSIAYFFGRIF